MEDLSGTISGDMAELSSSRMTTRHKGGQDATSYDPYGFNLHSMAMQARRDGGQPQLGMIGGQHGQQMLPLLEPLPVFGSPPGSPGQFHHPESAVPPATPVNPKSRKRKMSSHANLDDDDFDDAASSWNPSPEKPMKDGAVNSDWTNNDQEVCCRLFDSRMAEIKQPVFHIQIDKGFKRARQGGGFICQKKNHFQVTVQLQLDSDPAYVATPSCMRRVQGLFVVLTGIKMESRSTRIPLEQSQADRTKQPFQAVPITVVPNEVCRTTLLIRSVDYTSVNLQRTTCGRRGKPNPDQRYFGLVVTIAARAGDQYYPVASQVSEKVIVRASNPRQFESDPSATPSQRSQWVKGSTPRSLYHNGPVGINTDCPQEALSVNGNIRLSGSLLQPSDARIKTNVKYMSPQESLERLRKVKVYQYKLSQAWAETCGQDPDAEETGFLAQELMEVFPDAVTQTGPTRLADGTRLEHMLMVDKERVFTEAVGAVQHLAGTTDYLLQRLMRVEKALESLGEAGAQS